MAKPRLAILMMALAMGLFPRLDGNGRAAVAASPSAGPAALQLGVVPERDIYAQRRRHRVLAEYLAGRLGRPVEIVTVNTYEAVLGEMSAGRIDAAFLGSFVAVLAQDRLGAVPIVKPINAGAGVYRGILIVREDSPAKGVADLAGKRIAGVRTTTGGELFTWVCLKRAGLLGTPGEPEMVWAGTHDEAIEELMAGRADAAGVKSLRWEAYVAAHPEARCRILAESPSTPNNALLVRRDLADTVGAALGDILLQMDRTDAGKAALATYGVERFEPCAAGEYRGVCELVGELGSAWDRLGIDGPPVKCPGAAATHPSTHPSTRPATAAPGGADSVTGNRSGDGAAKKSSATAPGGADSITGNPSGDTATNQSSATAPGGGGH